MEEFELEAAPFAEHLLPVAALRHHPIFAEAHWDKSLWPGRFRPRPPKKELGKYEAIYKKDTRFACFSWPVDFTGHDRPEFWGLPPGRVKLKSESTIAGRSPNPRSHSAAEAQ